MDPEQTLRNLLMALASEERDAAVEACDALARWLARGGATPSALATRIVLALADASGNW